MRIGSTNNISLFLVISIVFTLTGCAVGPNYKKPEIAIPSDWNNRFNGTPTEKQADIQSLATWWSTLNDPELSSLITRAVEGNLDVKEARSRILESRARRGVAQAGLFPTLDVSGSEKWTRTGKDTGKSRTTKLISSVLDSGWEVDIFGGTRRSIEAASATMEGNMENLRDVLVSLLAEIAINYIEIRTYQARIAATHASIDTQDETYKLTVWRCEAGLNDELAVQQALYNLENTRSQIPTLQTGLEEALNRIAVLLGEQPGSVHKELATTEPIPVASAELAVGVPADLLRRRPDIRQAERELASQTANIGVATADLFPKLSLKGSIGIEAISFNELRDVMPYSDNWVLSGGPQITWAIFDAGAIRQNIKVQSALQEQALIQYESSILTALEEVENALISYINEQTRLENLRKATQAAKIASVLAEQQYQSGVSDFTDVLDAQRSLLSFQDQLAQSSGTVTSNLVRLYKALGGGWQSFAAEDEQ